MGEVWVNDCYVTTLEFSETTPRSIISTTGILGFHKWLVYRTPINYENELEGYKRVTVEDFEGLGDTRVSSNGISDSTKHPAGTYNGSLNKTYLDVSVDATSTGGNILTYLDLNLLPIEPKEVKWLHSGSPRHYHCLIQKFDIWSNFMAMWAGIATEEQAKRMVHENLLDEELFWAPYGVRTLSKKEKMYQIIKAGNPSCWQGPIWGISNYICFRALQKYGFIKEATELVEKTIRLFGNDIRQNGDLHEYYHPETGEGVNNLGFQNWNLLVNNMIAWLEGREMLHEE